MTYADWIKSYVASVNGHTLGKCGAAVASMLLEFPELREACGFAHCAWGPRQHWWCVAPDGTIVDPTVSQFPFSQVFEYEELDLKNPLNEARVPTGPCYWCGNDCFPPWESVCSQECNDKALADLNSASPT